MGSQELENVQTKRKELENELQSLNERETTLTKEIKAIKEKLVVQELEKLEGAVKAKREAG